MRQSEITNKGKKDMWWIIGIIAIIILVFLWMIVRSAARSVDENTQAMYDEEQTQYIAKYFKEKEGKEDRKQKASGTDR